MSKIYSDTDTITIVSRNHKMRDGAVNLKRFLALSTGLTVRDAHGLGIDNGYLRYYVRNGLIEIGASRLAATPEERAAAQERVSAWFASAARTTHEAIVAADPLGEAAFAAMAAEHGVTTRRGRRARA